MGVDRDLGVIPARVRDGGRPIRQAAALRAGAELIVAVDEVFRTAAEDPSDEPELAHAGARHGPAPTVRIAQGLKEKTMVGAEGLEPPTPSL